jgi:hypothetical protein
LLHRHTEGNPLFMVAVLEHLVGRGLVERDRDGWCLLRPAEEISLEVPESLRQMIGAQIEHLTEAEQRVLEVAAIAGMSFAPAIGAPSADMDTAAFEECCDALARRGHILRLAATQELPDGRIIQRYTFAHALYREALYERQAPARRVMLHRRRAEKLEEIFAASLDEVAPEVAHHFEKGADLTRAVKYLRLAAKRGPLDGARANLEHALAMAAKLPIVERAVAEVELLDALADMGLGTFDPNAVATLTLLREKAAEYGMVDVEAKALVDLAYPLGWNASERGLDVTAQALALSDAAPNPLTRAQIRARCMVRRIWIRGWNVEDAVECRRSLAEVRRLGTPQDVAWHVIDCNLVDFFSSQYRTAMRDAVDSLVALEGWRGESAYLSYVHSVKDLTVPWCLLLLGEWGAALREVDAGLPLAEKNGQAHRTQTLLLSRAWTLLHAMDFASARAVCDSLLPAFRQAARAPWRRLCLTIAGAAEAGLGNVQGALDHLLAARDEMDRHSALGDWYWRLQHRWALTSVWLATGDLAQARHEGELLVAEAGATDERTWQALAWDVNARISLASDELPRAHELIGRALTAIEGFEVPVAGWQAHATAADVARARGDAAAATHHRQTSRDIVLRLAASLRADEALRSTFLAAPAVAAVLRDE